MLELKRNVSARQDSTTVRSRSFSPSTDPSLRTSLAFLRQTSSLTHVTHRGEPHALALRGLVRVRGGWQWNVEKHWDQVLV